MRRLFLLIIVLAGVLPATFPAYACSEGGGVSSWDDVLWEGNAFAYVEVIQTDLYRQNAILRVYEVLYGDAPEKVLLLRTQPGKVVGVAEGFLGNDDCNFIQHPLQIGDKLYTNLYRQDDGTYSGLGTTFVFETPDSTITEGLSGEVAESTEAELRAHIEEFGGQMPHAPTLSDFPRFASLEITTDSGKVFSVPVDNGAPMALDSASERGWAEIGFWVNELSFGQDEGCTPQNCFLADDGGMAVRVMDGQVTLPNEASIPAESFALSPISGYLAAIQDTHLSLYSLGYIRAGTSDYVRPREIMRIERDLSRTSSNDLVWNADGTQLAYADSAGVWIWDVTTSTAGENCDCSEPVLTQLMPLTADNDLARPTAFSPDGSFVRVEQGDSAMWLRAAGDGDPYPDGWWSPDDRMLVTIVDERIEICAPVTYFSCNPVFIEVRDGAGKVAPSVVLRDVAWHNPFEMTLWACAAGDEDSCSAYFYQLQGTRHEHNSLDTIVNVRLFEYQPELDHLALVVGDTLIIDGKPIDVSGIDGEIASIRWLRPLWATE